MRFIEGARRVTIMSAREGIFDEVRAWLSSTEFEQAYIFGSLIHKNGSHFLKDRSDVDLVARFENDLNCLDRVSCVTSALQSTHELNLKLLAQLGRDDAKNSITSVISVSEKELALGIHKDGSKDFFSHNEFANVATGDVSKLGATLRLRSARMESVLDALRKAQDYRNKFLSISPSGHRKVADFEGPDSLPKALSRSAAQVRWGREVRAADDQRFDINEGQVYLLQLVAARRNDCAELEELFKNLAIRMGGRGENTPLVPEQQLLLWEILADDAMQVVSDSRSSKAASEPVKAARRKLAAAVKQKMLIDSGNRCAFPGCNVPLGENGIAEFAFIRHPTLGGPRYDSRWPPDKAVDPDNLIVLCPTHHAVIDRSPDDYPVSMILRWKKSSNAEELEFKAKNVVTLLRLILRMANVYF